MVQGFNSRKDYLFFEALRRLAGFRAALRLAGFLLAALRFFGAAALRFLFAGILIVHLLSNLRCVCLLMMM